MRPQSLRSEVIRVARALRTEGLTTGTSGNVSVRARQTFLITPTAVPYDAMKPSDIVEIDAAGTVLGGGRPSSEWAMHLAVYAARPEATAIVHAHPTNATALACLRRPIPAFHYMVAVAGGNNIRCARYETFGTEALGLAVVEALVDRRACLLANHGLVALGETLAEALALALEVESLCAQYLRALSVGPPTLLADHEMAQVQRRFVSYAAGRRYNLQRRRL